MQNLIKFVEPAQKSMNGDAGPISELVSNQTVPTKTKKVLFCGRGHARSYVRGHLSAVSISLPRGGRQGQGTQRLASRSEVSVIHGRYRISIRYL